MSDQPPVFGSPQPDPDQPPLWSAPHQPQAWPGPEPVRPGAYPPPPTSWSWPYPGPADPLISPDYGGWWRRTTTIVKNHWRPLVALQAVNAGASFVVLGLVFAVTAVWTARMSQALVATQDPSNARTPFEPSYVFPGQVLGTVGVVFAGVVVAVLIMFLVQLATTHLVVCVASGAPVSVAASLRAALRRLLPLVGWSLLGGLIVIGGVCACFLPAIYFAAVLYSLPAVVMVERTSVIGRCFTLFNKDLGVSVSRIATVYGLSLAGGIVTALVQQIIHLVAGTSASTAALVIGSLVGAAFQVVVASAISVVTGPALVTTYADMRARVEPVSTAVIAGEVFAA